MIISFLISFLITLAVLPKWIKKSQEIGLLWEDMNKWGHPKNVASSGGVIVVLGFVLGVLAYIAMRTFIINDSNGINLQIFALLSVILILAIVGLVDDLLGWRQGGLSVKFRLFLLLFASIPLVVINAGQSEVMGFNLGLFYPLILIPLGIMGATATYNFLAGYNGLEASQGILILSALAITTYFTGNSWLTIICLCMVACLFSFYIFNKFPAKVFPGDIMTYAIGALIAIIAILGNIEKIAIFFFIPYILETILKIRGRLKKQSFAKINEDNSLEMPYEKFYGLEHISIYLISKIKKNKKVYEKEVVYFINLFQLLIIFIGFALFWKSIF